MSAGSRGFKVLRTLSTLSPPPQQGQKPGLPSWRVLRRITC